MNKPGSPPNLRPAIVPAIVIAAGGEGSRIGGSKPGRCLGGKPLITRMIDWAQTHSDCVAVAVRDADQLPGLDLPLLADRVAGIGPIGALESAFHFAVNAKRPRVLMIGCDQPFLPDDLLDRLGSVIDGCGAAMPHCQGRDQPMACLWRVDGAALAAYIGSGGRALHRFSEQVGTRRAEWLAGPDGSPFANINDLGALENAERRLKIQER